MALPTNSVVLHDPAAQRWLQFQEPVQVLQATSAACIPALLEEIQREVDRHNLYAAGFLAYEAAPAFDSAFKVHACGDFPLAWFGLYNEPQPIACPSVADNSIADIPWASTVSPQEYDAALHEIKNHIRAGDTYQVNYSLRLHAPFGSDPWTLFVQIVRAQGAHYGAFLNLEDWAICCASPELFFLLDGTELVSRPMKGTARRGLWPAQDAQNAEELHYSEKNRAENIMIVDMVRNDLGRVAQMGSVGVTQLFALEKYPTVWQMTSTVGCRTKASLPEIFRALFPAASITGAPKVRTMEIIRDLETSPRRIYTGAIGFIAPGRRAQFNVAIRTVLIDKRGQQAEYGVGGGIVWDSVPALELEECRVKAKVLTATTLPFALLETILWNPAEGYFLLEGHLSRLTESAAYFSWPVAMDDLRKELAELSERLRKSGAALPQRVRLQLHPSGAITLEALPISPLPKPYRLGIASHAINTAEVFLYHKTTYRHTYEEALAGRRDCDDFLFFNENGELTESSIANLLIEKNGDWLTPPLHCGLLAGVYRNFLLESKKVKEETIYLQDLTPDCKLYLVNSLREMWPVLLSPPCEWDGSRFPRADRAGPAHGFSAGQK